MGDRSNAPIIIKRKKVVGGDGHHGGAWKVAYADFVTAMMAFFLLMWLLNATTEQQRKGIADYFSPTIPVNRVSGGGDGLFNGTDIFTEETLAQTGTGQSGTVEFDAAFEPNDEMAAEVAALESIERALLGIGGESLVEQDALRHVITRLTDEGLVIEVFAREGAPLFRGDTDTPMPVLVELTEMFGRVFQLVTNPIAVEGHIRSRPITVRTDDGWDVSTGRAEAVRVLLEGSGIAPDRMARITGHSDRDLAELNALAVRNDRIEITLLRQTSE
ncbi:MAG: flagellar motor protein MotB [Pseudomonadota bacterium]